MAGYRPSASMGIAMYPDHGLSVPELLRSADTAMYAAKTGHGRVAFYQSDMRREASHLLDLRNALTGAVERGEFQLFYQPICRISDGIMVGAEALLRWHRPGHGLLLPGDFLHVADLVDAMLLAALYDGPHSVMNVGSGKGRTVLDVVSSIDAVLGLQGAEILHKAGRVVDVPANVLDTALIRRELGWTVRRDWMQGLAETAEWLRSVEPPAITHAGHGVRVAP